MTHEDFVTYEQAEKLKELGFRWKCHYRFNIDKQIVPNVVYNNCGVDSDDVAVDVNFRCIGDISAPTLAQAQKWLREVKDIIIGIDFDNWHDKYECHVYKRMGYKGELIRDTYGSQLVTNEFHEDFDTYEQAFSAGINKALEYLKQ